MAYRSRIFSSILLAAVALSTAPSLAADIDGVVYADDANFVKPAELGSGWYLRADVAYNFNLQQERGFDYDPVVGLPSLRYRFGDSFAYGIGFGKQINSLLRADITVDRVSASDTAYTGGRSFTGTRLFDYSYTDGAGDEVTEDAVVIIGRDAAGNFVYTNDCAGAGAAQCATSAAALSYAIGGNEKIDLSYSVWSTLVNGYVDLPSVAGFKPYIGAGVGMARPSATLQHLVDCVAAENEACGLPTGGYGETIEDYELVNDTYAKWLPTFAVSAGTSYQVTDNIALDLGYRYQHIMNIDSVLDGADIDNSLLDDKESIHSVRLGVRVTAF